MNSTDVVERLSEAEYQLLRRWRMAGEVGGEREAGKRWNTRKASVASLEKASWGEYGVHGRGVLEKEDTEDLTGHFKDFNFDCKEMGKSLRYSEQRSDLMKPTFF